MNTGSLLDHINNVAVIVAHPDDETLWAGGVILSHPSCTWHIISLCRSSDMDRASRFHLALKTLKARGAIGDMDDGPEQPPLVNLEVENAILNLLPKKHFDLILSHNPKGEYTRHIRHEEIGKAVIKLWNTNRITTNEYWAFAYEDGNKHYLPKSHEAASIRIPLKETIWKKKYQIITEIYGFEKKSWEARTTPKTEAFWQFNQPGDALVWMEAMNKSQQVQE